MQLPASIEADEYSGWDDADFDADAPQKSLRAPPESTDSTPDRIVLVVETDAHGERLDKWLAGQVTAYSRARLQRWIVDGHVKVNDASADVRRAVRVGDRVTVDPQTSEEQSAFVAEDLPLAIVFEDDALIVIDKPAGLVVHPAAGNWRGTLLNGLLHHDPSLAHVPRAGIVHRLDKDTTGLMVVAKTVIAQTDLVRQLQARTVGRSYVALVDGTPLATGRIALAIGRDPRDRLRMAAFATKPEAVLSSGAKPAATRFETLATVTLDGGRSVSVVLCTLETGRTHQIRVHMQALGHPLIGERVYGGSRPGLAFDRQALHAWRLQLQHPVTRDPRAWTAPLPDDLRALTQSLGIDVPAMLEKRVS